jgi:hypothetical protein
MFKKLSNYLNDQKRWNELGHSMFSFIMGSLHPIITILWVLFVFVDELFIDGHWNFWRETKDEQLDFLFDLQSKLIPTIFSYYLFQNIYYLNISLIDSIVCFVVIFFFGYKGSWFYSKKK